jgi:AcrR family transcriptional regulator
MSDSLHVRIASCLFLYNMSMASYMSTPKRRVPQQDRGERRVAEVLEAAAAVIADVGYEGATMTEMAERAGASIGALYQYFPNKEAIARALRQQYADELERRWAPLAGQGSALSVKQLVDRIFDVMLELIENQPAYIPLLNVPGFKRDPAAKNRLREHFAMLFREKRPEMTPEDALRVANVTVQVVKGLKPLYADAKGAEREGIVREFKLLLTRYLTARLRA